MAQITYTQVVKANLDAGLFRQFLAQSCGDVLTYGGSGSAMERAVRLAKQLARLTGQTLEQVCDTVRADYALIEA